MAACRDCSATVEWRRIDGRNVSYDPSGEPHWLTCPAPRAADIRRRRGREAGVFPVSPSELDAYAGEFGCPRYYLLRNFARLQALGLLGPDILAEYPEPPVLPENPAGLLGRAFHQLVAANLKGEEPPTPIVPLQFARDWAIMVGSFERQFERGEWNVEDASIEERRQYTWPDGDMTVELQVVLDYWRYQGSHATLTDWKTGWAIESERELVGDVQALTNALVLMRDFPQIKTVRFQQVHFRYGGQVVGVDFERRDIDRFEDLLRAQVGRIIRDTDYVPNPFCTSCPPGAHPVVHYPVKVGEGGEIALEPPRSRDEADQLARYVFAAERLAKTGREALRGWCADNGDAGGYGHHAQTSRGIADIREAIRVLEAAGHDEDMGDFIRFDGTKLRSILESKRKWVSLAEDLAPLLVKSTKTEFDYKASKEPVEAGPARLEVVK